MQVFHTRSKITITCNKRLSPYLRHETEALGFTVNRDFGTGIELNGTLTDCITLNLNLRCASQVLYSIQSFNARNAEDLYAAASTIAWEKLIDFSGYFSVVSVVDNQTINTPLFANLKIKDAIADRIKSKMGLRPDSGPKQNRALIHLHWKDEQAELFIDSSGETLAKHGYRKLPGKAPMLEALAASILMATGWDKNSPVVVPMCGSGTLAIEAALLAAGKAPGLFRMNYGFMHILGYDEDAFVSERKKLKENNLKSPGLHIVATDIDAAAVAAAKKNAQTAGVDHLIDFAVCDFEQTTVPDGNGVVIFNPEYGERLGNITELERTYARMGDFMKQKCRGYTGFVFTGNPGLAKKIGLKASARIEFYNGRLDCRLFRYELYAGSRREKPAEN